jgi:hypothetical protein
MPKTPKDELVRIAIIASEPVRLKPIRENEVLYDKSGLAVAIKSNGQILAIIEGYL